MKLNRIQLAKVIGFIERNHAINLSENQIECLDDIIDIEVPEMQQQVVYPKNENIERLMMLMAEGTRKIEAIKEHRAITGMGLKESKDAVERYWPDSSAKWTLNELYAKLKAMPSSFDHDVAVEYFLNNL